MLRLGCVVEIAGTAWGPAPAASPSEEPGLGIRALRGGKAVRPDSGVVRASPGPASSAPGRGGSLAEAWAPAATAKPPVAEAA